MQNMKLVCLFAVIFRIKNGYGYSVFQSRARNVDQAISLTKRDAFTKHRPQLGRQRNPHSVTVLGFRPLNDDDSEHEVVMNKLKTRAPPGFDMRQAMQEQKPSETTKNAINVPLIKALLFNQVLLFVVATVLCSVLLVFHSGTGAFSDLNTILNWANNGLDILDLPTTPTRLAWGVGGALPIIALGYLIESSDNRVFANLNFSTIVLSMTLFGRRKQPPPAFIPDQKQSSEFPTTNWLDACFQSFVLSLVTGVCEETIFRLFVPSLIMLFFSSGGDSDVLTALIGSATLFGAGHIQPRSGVSYNSIVFLLQFFNGIGFGLIYVLSGGDIVPCILAHVLYDFITFFKTWLDANSQIEYAESMFLEPLPPAVENEVRSLLRSSRVQINPKLFATIKRLFYTFDFDKNQSLSLSEVRKGISYMALEKAGTPPPQQAVDQLFSNIVQTRDDVTSERNKDRLSFSDFVRLYAMLRRGTPRTMTSVQ